MTEHPLAGRRPAARRLGAARRIALLAALLALALAACGGGLRSGYTVQRLAVGDLAVALEHPQRVDILQDYELFIALTDAAGQPVDGAQVYLDLDMPAMPMGVNQPIADPLGGGRYRARGVFTMEGEWRVTVHATVAGQEYAAGFDQTVTLPE